MSSAMEPGHPLGAVGGLWRYPVKSLAAEALERTDIVESGLSGDRQSALFVTSHGHARLEKPFRGKEHNLLHTLTETEAALALAAGEGVNLEKRSAGPYFDTGVVSLLFDRWLAELEALVGLALDPLRFRPNLFARASDPLPSEEALVGTRLQIGTVVLRVVKPNLRCVTPTYDVADGTPNPAVLRAVAQHRENVMGVYCNVERPGTLGLGDAILCAPA
jgi:uncharacterized protein YcbX